MPYLQNLITLRRSLTPTDPPVLVDTAVGQENEARIRVGEQALEVSLDGEAYAPIGPPQAWGRQAWQANATVTDVQFGSFVDIAGTSIAGLLEGFSTPGDNALQYDGAADIIAQVAMVVSVNYAAINKGYTYAVGLNGNRIFTSQIVASAPTSTSLRLTHFTNALVTLTAGDVLSAMVQGETDGTDITVRELSLTATAVGFQ